MRISKDLYNMILCSTPNPPPECGGIIGGNEDIVTTFVSDKGLQTDAAYRYVPDTEKLNKVIEYWINSDIDFLGVYHTHPKSDEKLSNTDISYINNIMRGVSEYTNKLYFPLIIPGEKIIVFYALIIADEIEIFQEAIKLI